MESTDELTQQLARAVRRKRRRRPASRESAAWSTRQPDPVSPSQRAGGQAEARALDYLLERGLTLVTRNFRCKAGEIDLVVRDGDVLVFVEVRARRSQRYGGAAASVDHAKRGRLLRAAQWYLWTAWRGPPPRCRFDIVAFEPQGCVWLRDAFREA